MDTNWSKLSNTQMETFGRYFAKMEFESFGFEVYSSEKNEKGIDFIARRDDGFVYEVQTKTILYSSEQCRKSAVYSLDIANLNMHINLLLFKNGKMPDSFLIPAMAWKFPNDLFSNRITDGNKFSTGYVLNISKRSLPILENYKFGNMLESL